MTFDMGAKILGNLIEQITTNLIGTGVWHNVDTTWNTLDKTANNARHIMAYGAVGALGKGNTTLSTDTIAGATTIDIITNVDFAIGDNVKIGSGMTSEIRKVTAVATNQLTLDAAINIVHSTGEIVMEIDIEIYLSLEAINTSTNYYWVAWPTNNWWYGKGIRAVFCSDWNGATHTFAGNIQSTFIPFETCQYCGVGSDLATLQLSYYLWTENNGNGFVFMGKPSPTGVPQEQSFIIVVERLISKEYIDGFSNFYLYSVCNIWSEVYNSNQNTMWRWRSVLRPFAYQWPDGAVDTSASPNGNGISFSPLPSYVGYKSIGNGKVYYIKPIINNQANQLAPISQSELFFMWNENLGLIDGDVVALQGQPIKYLCKALDSPDSVSRLTFAIKYLG